MRRHAPIIFLGVLSLWLAVVFGGAAGSAQFQMPDPKQMSGIPRPVDDLPGGSVSVRLIRGELSNNIANFPVDLQVNGKVQTVKTDDAGRAQFDKLPAGATLKAVAVVDGERLESQEFPAPAQGGIRLMLVATDKEKERQKAALASAPAVAGTVAIGGESRIVLEPSDESVSVYYILEIVNRAATPVNPPAPFGFDMAKGLARTTILEGSSPLATVSGSHVDVAGPFPPGTTLVEVGSELPATKGGATVDQAFPAAIEQLAVIVRKVGNTKLTSPQIARQQDTVSEGTPIIVGAVDAIAASQPLKLELSGLPYQSGAPREIAIGLVLLIAALGVWGFSQSHAATDRTAERNKLVARREKLFQDLIRLEHDHRRGRVDDSRYDDRREELVLALESIYGALDSDDMSHDSHAKPAATAGQLGTS